MQNFHFLDTNLQLSFEIGDVRLAVRPMLFHLLLESLARRQDELAGLFVLLARRLLDLLHLGREGSHLGRFELLPALLSRLELLLDVLDGHVALRRRRTLRRSRLHVRLAEDHLVAEAAAGLLLAPDLGRCEIFLLYRRTEHSV